METGIELREETLIVIEDDAVAKNILELVGKTPVVRINSLSDEVDCNVYAKLENLNPGGSHKIRIALAMIHDAERRGILTRGSGQVILEPSGGNTGIGLAMAGAVYGYRTILVVPDNYSADKQELLKLYGAEVLLSDSRLGNNSHGEKAMEILLSNPDYVMLNQQRNPANPEIHRRATAEEIIRDFQGKQIDFFVCGIGTGGHITGIGERLKEKWPSLEVIGVEPEGCDLLNDQHVLHRIQGLSVGLVPEILNTSILSHMEAVSEAACLDMVQQVMRADGISLGVSSAANLVAIRQLSGKSLSKGATVLTMIYDGVESYMDYFNKNEFASRGSIDHEVAISS